MGLLENSGAIALALIWGHQEVERSAQLAGGANGFPNQISSIIALERPEYLTFDSQAIQCQCFVITVTQCFQGLFDLFEGFRVVAIS